MELRVCPTAAAAMNSSLPRSVATAASRERHNVESCSSALEMVL